MFSCFTFFSEDLRHNPHYNSIFEDCVKTCGEAFEHPTMKKLLDDPNTRFDIVIAVYIFGHEAGYYLAERFRAQLVLYFTAQLAIPTIDHALGIPHHPALLPFGPTHFPHRMNFWQRTINFLALNYAEHVFRYGQ